MNKTLMHHSERVYALLLQLYPQSYRRQFGKEMQYVFSQSLRDASIDQGVPGVVSFLYRTSVDVCKSVATQHLENKKEGVSVKIRNVGLIALVTALLLLIPLVGRWPWEANDFVIMGILIFGTGLMLELVRAKVRTTKHRIVVALAIVGLFLWIWAELAVGVFTNLGS